MCNIDTTTKKMNEWVNYSKQLTYTCNLKEIRIASGLSQADLGREIGKTSNFVNMIENKKYFPILETRIKIAKALNTDTSAIWIMELKTEVDKDVQQK